MAYREEMNSVKRFIAEALELDNDSRETLSVVKETYKNWCKDECLQPFLKASSKMHLLMLNVKKLIRKYKILVWFIINPLEKDFDNYGF